MVQREYTKTGPEAIGSLFIRNWSAKFQVNETFELRIDLKTVEPSYTSAPYQLKSRITSERCFLSVNYSGR